MWYHRIRLLQAPAHHASRSMRIALLSAEYPPQPGGVGDYTRRLGAALAACGQAAFVLTIRDRRFTIYELGPHGAERPFEIADRGSDWNWRCWPAVIAALDRVRPDVLHIQYQTAAYGMHPAINLLPWRLRSLPIGPQVAVTPHDLLPPYLFPKAGPLRRWMTRRLLADADAVVATNEQDYAQVQGERQAPPAALRPRPAPTALIPIGSNIAVAPPDGYDRATWRARLGVAAHELLIVYFGLVSRSKGVDVLLGTLARLPDRFRLLMVGGAATQPEDRAYAAGIQRQIDERRLRRRVIVAGHCAEAEVSAHLLAADMAALPFVDGASFRRGSLLAALAHGLPTVTTSAPTDQRPMADKETRRQGDKGTRGQGDNETETQHSTLNTQHFSSILHPGSSIPGARLVDGEHVLLAPPHDAEALAAAIECLAGDAALRARIGGGGRALAARFSWETIAAQHAALYRDLLAYHP
jgi:polysaccharide biosynthesis protein PslF